MYPWRQKNPACTGISFIQHTASSVSTTTEKACINLDPPIHVSPLLSVGISDLEYSMEPRNFSRGPSKPLLTAAPVVAARLDSAENVDVPVVQNFSQSASKPLLTAAPVVTAPLDSAENVDVPVDTDKSRKILSANDRPPVAASSAISAEDEAKVETFYDELVSISDCGFVLLYNYSVFF